MTKGVETTDLDIRSRIMNNIAVSETGCWEWQRRVIPAGYGYMSTRGKLRPVHRVSYEFFVGPIHPDQEIDHLCRNRKCVNAEHLEAVTHRINFLRGIHPTAVQVREGRCAKGHDASNINRQSSKQPYCRVCRNIRRKTKVYT